MKMQVSIILPFYNEEANAERVVTELLAAMRGDDREIGLICVQNGSRDRTGEILARLAQANPSIKVVSIETNRGYGFGIRQGLQAAGGEIVGYLDGDGQVKTSDVLRVLDRMKTRRAAKAARVVRGDGLQRRLVSSCYNALFKLLFCVRARDANAKPKFLRKEDLAKLALVSNDWFVDAEVMIKSSALGIEWAEEAVEFHKRASGASHVRIGSIVEFLKNLWCWRFGRIYRTWKRTALQS
jgi:glycosyltransferase involved in cell wall biosynthesis